ncbi:hypothetical protein P170DRAFT_322486, partial [Aspergillus steynii IBT 23096]
RIRLRILPLGASITWGQNSASGNGYRKPLRDRLQWQGNEVNMVGSKNHGTMKDNNVEATPGDTIDQVKAAAQLSLHFKPNIVLINAGTNDCAQDIDIENAGVRMRALIESIVNTKGMRQTVIVLSTLFYSDDKAIEMNRTPMNRQFRDLVVAMKNEGVSIYLAEMDPDKPAPGNGWLKYPEDYIGTSDKPDPTHPNEFGYAKMAWVWFKAIEAAAKEQKIPDVGPEAGICERSRYNGVDAGGLTQRGSGDDDGVYIHDAESIGEVLALAGGEPDKERDETFFARLFSPKRSDMLRMTPAEMQPKKTVYTIWQNKGPGVKKTNETYNFHKEQLDVDSNCGPAGVNFRDINGDGLDDFICIGPDGTAYGSLNLGDGSNEKAPTFRDIDQIKDPEGYDRDHVRLGDIDGDGRTDYCVIHDDGGIYCWRNMGGTNVDDQPIGWQAMGKRFTGKGMGDIRGVRFVDISGDGRDDWLWVGDDGQVTTWTNSRSCVKSDEGDGPNIEWRQAVRKGQNQGPTHEGMGGFAKDGVRDRIHFAKVFSEYNRDYVFIQSNKDGLVMRVWRNRGTGGTTIKSDGNRYCNMMGHTNGMADYLWVSGEGKITLYGNRGMGSVTDNGDSFWDDGELIFDPIAVGVGPLDRANIHLTDWDNDGKCDIVRTFPEDSTKLMIFRNEYSPKRPFNPAKWSTFMSTDVRCDARNGRGPSDPAVHFADITGNGQDDFLCVSSLGHVEAYEHRGGEWHSMGMIWAGDYGERSGLQFADVDGDGRADIIRTNLFNGDGTVWYNHGPREGAKKDESKWKFEATDSSKPAFLGQGPADCTFYPDLDGDGHADQHVIMDSLKNTARTWFTKCDSDDILGDDGPAKDPHLPEMP